MEDQTRVFTDLELLCIACEKATDSPDPSTQNGALLVRPYGPPIFHTLACNEFPRGVKYSDDRWERPAKYGWIEHAERNAIYNAAYYGTATEHLTMVCPWAACADCARAIVQAGIAKLIRVSAASNTNPRWMESILQADVILKEGGVVIVEYPGPIPGAPLLRRDGELIAI